MSIGSLPRIGLLAACVALSLGAGPAADKTTIRPFIALMHPGQVSAPQTVPGDGMTAFFQFDVKAHTLQFTLSGGDSTLSYAIRGPTSMRWKICAR